ncbi:uncharacterized protein LOC119662125 [Teleopsis dalmanni]|uniref:uncharacterized protein LOC119662125 n=1 Tax=Teleopsis dalmanni TaxID=139649 RepID=UPI0018CE0D29|nr:uncharacterized protein LOC119662125 [Teleopsis dalmanni]
MWTKVLLPAVILLIINSWIVLAEFSVKMPPKDRDMMRKYIVFDKKTPNVFYCPRRKPTSMEKIIVKSQPLYKLCEFQGQPLPDDYKPDCYLNVDESEYACKEKYRIMKRISNE